MSLEQEPEEKRKKAILFKDESIRDEMADLLKRSRILRFAVNEFIHTIARFVLFYTPDGRDRLRKSGGELLLLPRRSRVGFLEDSILGNPLLYPVEEQRSLEKDDAPAGRLVAYDFVRPHEFGPKSAPLER